jgi:hypothetical protein
MRLHVVDMFYQIQNNASIFTFSPSAVQERKYKDATKECTKEVVNIFGNFRSITCALVLQKNFIS